MRLDNRSILRKILRCHAKVAMAGRPPLNARTVDISPNGMCLLVAEQLPAGLSCNVSFEVPLNGKMKKVQVIAKAVYSVFGTDGFRIGMQFTQVDPASAAVIDEIWASG